MSNFYNRLQFYIALNTGFSSNYTCLRVAEQKDKYDPEPEQQIFIGRDAFRSSSDSNESWLSTKLSSAAKNRNYIIQTLNETLSESDDAYQIIIEDLEEKTNTFVEYYNKCYKTNKTAKELLNGFECLDKNFQKLAKTSYISSCIPITTPEKEAVINTYFMYIDSYEKYTLLRIFFDISEQLDRAVTNYGRKSIRYSSPENPLVKILKSDEIEKYTTAATSLLYKQKDELEKSKKALSKGYKTGLKLSETDIFAAADSIGNLTLERSKSEMKLVAAGELYNIAISLGIRMQHANSDNKTKFSNVLLETVTDIFAGINVFKPEKPKFDEVYVHQYELDYLNFLFSILETSPEKIMQENEAKQKQ